MIVVANSNCIFVDCDDTLVMWDDKYKKDDLSNCVLVADPNSGFAVQLVPHDDHIRYIKNAKQFNHQTIVVWSAGGWEWAKAVVEALGLQEYVDAVMEKPTMYIDDLV